MYVNIAMSLEVFQMYTGKNYYFRTNQVVLSNMLENMFCNIKDLKHAFH